MSTEPHISPSPDPDFDEDPGLEPDPDHRPGPDDSIRRDSLESSTGPGAQ